MSELPKHDALLNRAIADRDARPWNYYRLDHGVMKRLLNEQAMNVAQWQAEAETNRQAWLKAKARGDELLGLVGVLGIRGQAPELRRPRSISRGSGSH